MLLLRHPVEGLTIIVGVEAVRVCLLVLIGAFLLAAAWLDHRFRALPLWLPLALLLSTAATFAQSSPFAVTPEVLLGALLMGGLGFLALITGSLGLSDVIIGAALALLVLSLDLEFQVEAALSLLLGTAAAVLIWTIHRVSRSLIIAGRPSNGWDLLALLKGHPDHEPHLSLYRLRRRDTWLLEHIEAFRTPREGSRLSNDPCPLVTCLSCGYLALLGALLYRALVATF